jgi:hypothetical protein
MSLGYRYLAVFDAERWGAPLLAAASDRTSKVSGPTGVKMSGPCALSADQTMALHPPEGPTLGACADGWVPPNFWDEADGFSRDFGGAFGFNTEVIMPARG